MKRSSVSWSGRSVLVTGHTGFKGGWLSLWLRELGALVHGYSLQPLPGPNLYVVGAVGSAMASETLADLEEFETLRNYVSEVAPEVVFHLAAQPLVRDSYVDPLGTFRTNVLGTAHLLEATRHTSSVRAIVVVTTDKVYENREWTYPYREVDALGGRDPYSASKAAAEMVSASYRASFFSHGATALATARAGNVIGGADWARDRLVPDCLRAFSSGQAARLRNPHAVRPWQHVLEPLSGYLALADHLLTGTGAEFASAYNFGPEPGGDATVLEVATLTARCWGPDARLEPIGSDGEPHEAGLLRLDSTRARTQLGWSPRWSLNQAVQRTVDWHRAWELGTHMPDVCRRQIHEYMSIPTQ